MILSRPAVEAGRKARLSARRSKEKVDPYLRPLYDALGDLLDDAIVERYHRARHDRSRSAGLHARPHALRCVRDSRRSAERNSGSAQDVFDAAWAAGRRCRQRRRDANRFAVGRAQRTARGRAALRRSSTTSASSSSTRPTSCATRWSPRSSRARMQIHYRNNVRGSGMRSAGAQGVMRNAARRGRSRGCSRLADAGRDAAIRALNREHRGKDRPTDVLSFPLEPEGFVPEAIARRYRHLDRNGAPSSRRLRCAVAARGRAPDDPRLAARARSRSRGAPASGARWKPKSDAWPRRSACPGPTRG